MLTLELLTISWMLALAVAQVEPLLALLPVVFTYQLAANMVLDATMRRAKAQSRKSVPLLILIVFLIKKC